MQIDLAALPDDPAALQQMLREFVTAAERQQSTLQQRDAEIDKQHLLIKRLLRQQFGRRSEQLSADQLQLALEDLEQTVAANEAAQDSATDKQRQRRETHPNRNHGALSAHLPRYEVLIDVEHSACPCCVGAMHTIGELRTEQLDIVPAQLHVRVTRRPRYACLTCEGAVLVAPAPERPIDDGMAIEALEAHGLVSKYCDSLPLYRQSPILARQGVTLDRSTLSNWVGRACWWLTPLYELMVSTALSAPKLFADDTTLPVLVPGRGRTKTGRIWCYAADNRPWSGPTHPVAAYVYTEDRRNIRPANDLFGYAVAVELDGQYARHHHQPSRLIRRITGNADRGVSVAAEPKVHFRSALLQMDLDPRRVTFRHPEPSLAGRVKRPMPVCRWGEPQRSYNYLQWFADLGRGLRSLKAEGALMDQSSVKPMWVMGPLQGPGTSNVQKA